GTVASVQAVTADPGNQVSLISAFGNIHLKPPDKGIDYRGAPAPSEFQSYYPASFSATACGGVATTGLCSQLAGQAPLPPSQTWPTPHPEWFSTTTCPAPCKGGNIFVENPITFWPSPTGTISFKAYNTIQGLPLTVTDRDTTNYVPLFVGFGGSLGGHWELVDLRTMQYNQTLLFVANYNPKVAGVSSLDTLPGQTGGTIPKYYMPPNAPPMPFKFTDLPTVQRTQNTITVNLLPSDPQSFLGKELSTIRLNGLVTRVASP